MFQAAGSTNFNGFPHLERLSVLSGVKLVVFVTTFQGRSIFYALSEEIPEYDGTHDAGAIDNWARSFCEVAQESANGLSGRRSEGLFGSGKSEQDLQQLGSPVEL